MSEIVPSELKSAELTAKWEKTLDLIAKGQFPPDKFMNSIKNYTTFLVEEAKKCKSRCFDDIKKEKGSNIGVCKLCGGEIIEHPKGWSCSNWKNGCKTFIPTEKCGIQLEPYLKDLISKHETGPIEGFISQNGNKFTARLILKAGKLDMEFINKK